MVAALTICSGYGAVMRRAPEWAGLTSLRRKLPNAQLAGLLPLDGAFSSLLLAHARQPGLATRRWWVPWGLFDYEMIV